MPRCRHCKELFEQYEFNNKFCTKIDCKVQKGLYLLDKMREANKKAIKSEQRNKRTLYPDTYLKDNKKDLQNAVNEIARLIDKGCRCIDCDRTEAKPCWDGGHKKSVGSHSPTRYNLHNIFKQTRYCNSMSEGRKGAFEEGIKDMYGQEYLELVNNLPLKYPTLKDVGLTPEKIVECLKEARKIVRELKKADLVYPTKIRIELREKYNKRIGIYEV